MGRRLEGQGEDQGQARKGVRVTVPGVVPGIIPGNVPKIVAPTVSYYTLQSRGHSHLSIVQLLEPVGLLYSELVFHAVARDPGCGSDQGRPWRGSLLFCLDRTHEVCSARYK